MARTQEELLLSVADVLLIDNETGLEYASATLKSHNISQSVDTAEIRAGRKNAIIATLENNKTITVEIEDVHANRDWIAIALNTDVDEESSVDIRVLPKKFVVNAEKKVTLDKTPKAGQTVQFYGADRKLVASQAGESGQYTLSAANEGDVVECSSYLTTVAKADVMHIGLESAGRTFSMFLEESVFNNDMKIIATKLTHFPNVTADSNFSMAGSSELAEQNVTYTFTVKAADGLDELGTITYIPEAAE